MPVKIGQKWKLKSTGNHHVIVSIDGGKAICAVYTPRGKILNLRYPTMTLKVDKSPMYPEYWTLLKDVRWNCPVCGE